MTDTFTNKIETAYLKGRINNRTFEYLMVDDLDNWLKERITDLKYKQKKKDLTAEGLSALGILLELKNDIGRLK